jgi:hypothetical protein
MQCSSSCSMTSLRQLFTASQASLSSIDCDAPPLRKAAVRTLEAMERGRAHNRAWFISHRFPRIRLLSGAYIRRLILKRFYSRNRALNVMTEVQSFRARAAAVPDFPYGAFSGLMPLVRTCLNPTLASRRQPILDIAFLNRIIDNAPRSPGPVRTRKLDQGHTEASEPCQQSYYKSVVHRLVSSVSINTNFPPCSTLSTCVLRYQYSPIFRR